MILGDAEINAAINKIKQSLDKKNLATELEMIVKHLPTYNKIIKTHISQLQSVLASDNHHNKSIDNINLSPTVKQLISIFDKLENDDLQKLEELHLAASNWQAEKINTTNKNPVSEAAV